MTAVTTVGSGIAFGAYDVVVAGGVEHMGRHPMGEGVDPNPRFLAEKLVDPSALVMGQTAKICTTASRTSPRSVRTRSRLASQDKLAKAYANGKIEPDLVTMATRNVEQGFGLASGTSRRGRATIDGRPGCAQDAVPPARPGDCGQLGRAQRRRDCVSARVRRDRPRARPAGTDAPGVLRFVGVEPEVMGVGPIPPPRRSSLGAGLTIDDIGLFELNEAFAVQVLAFLDHFGIADDDPRVNEYGGAIAVGHPLAVVRRAPDDAAGAANSRTTPTCGYGLTAMCVGIGMGAAVIWENPNWDGSEQ